MSIVPHRIISSTVDWLTVTAKNGDAFFPLLDLGITIKADAAQVDPSIHDWHWHGYEGLIGAHFAIGKRYDGAIVQVHAYLAEKYWKRLVEIADHATRCDIQVTVQYDEYVDGVADDAYLRGCRANEGNPRAPKSTLIRNNAGGSTLYVGDRESDLFARCYDKWNERKDEQWKNCWRWELEVKGDVAGRLVARLAASADWQRDVLDIVCTHYVRRQYSSGWMEGRRTLCLQTQRQPSGVASRLKWLYSSVRPAIDALLPIVERDELLLCLGLDEANVRRRCNPRDDQLGGETMPDI